MEKNDPLYKAYIEILNRELISAMGCTEPIAVAYCAAAARKALGALPERIVVEASGNIIKNVKSVVVPHTGNRRGLAASACVGARFGDAEAGLEVISAVSAEQIRELGSYMEKTKVEVKPLVSDCLLDMIITVYAGNSYAKVRIAEEHTNIVRIEKDGKVLLEKDVKAEKTEEDESLYELLEIQKIFDFADTCDLEDVRDLLEGMIEQNSAIAEEGLKKDYGANIGKVLLKTGTDVKTIAKAYAAAASDARMNGCELPVVICSGSGNQGITTSLPVVVYAKALNVSKDTLYRALLVSALTTIHAKTGIGRLSAYCGAVTAGAGAGAGIAYLNGGREEEIAHTIINALAIASGIVCDGAKSSCAAKIATAVETGIFGYEMYCSGQQFFSGDGLVAEGVENTIDSFAKLARIGMRDTDRQIILMMTEESGKEEESRILKGCR